MELKFAEIPDALWAQIEPLLPGPPSGPRRGRPIPNRTILSGIVATCCRSHKPPRDVLRRCIVRQSATQPNDTGREDAKTDSDVVARAL